MISRTGISKQWIPHTPAKDIAMPSKAKRHLGTARAIACVGSLDMVIREIISRIGKNEHARASPRFCKSFASKGLNFSKNGLFSRHTAEIRLEF